MRLALVLVLFAAAAPAAAQDEAVPEPPPSVELRPATVRFRANLEGLQVLYLQDPVLDENDMGLVIRLPPAHRYVELCEAPCDRELPQTHLGLAVARGDQVIRFTAPLGVDGPTGVSLRWQSRDDSRLAGILTATLGGGLGFAIGIGSLLAATDDAALGAGVGTGGTLMLGAIVIGLFLALMQDDAAFEAAPLPSEGDGLFSDQWDPASR